MRRFPIPLFVALVAASTVSLSALSGTASAANSDADVGRTFASTFPFTMLAEKHLRRCVEPGSVYDCETSASSVKTRALIGMSGMRNLNVALLSAQGRRARLAGFEAYRRLWLAATSFMNGSYRNFVAHEKQAIQQAATTAKLTGRETWFNSVMALAGCPLWRVALRIPSKPACS